MEATTPAAAGTQVGVGVPVPVLRVFDEALARAFYVDFLGFQVDWEHRFEPGLPLYFQVSRDDARLHLTEHYGDGTPGSVVWVPVRDLRALHTELAAQNASFARPGVDMDAPGGSTLDVSDPFGNSLRFCQPE